MEKKKYEAPEMEAVMVKMQNHVLITSENPDFGGEGDPDKDLD